MENEASGFKNRNSKVSIQYCIDQLPDNCMYVSLFCCVIRLEFKGNDLGQHPEVHHDKITPEIPTNCNTSLKHANLHNRVSIVEPFPTKHGKFHRLTQ